MTENFSDAKSSENLETGYKRVSDCPYRKKQVHKYKSERAEVWVCKIKKSDDSVINNKCPHHGNKKLSCSMSPLFRELIEERENSND